MREKSKEPERPTFHSRKDKKPFDLRDLVKKTPAAFSPASSPKTCGSGTIREQPPKRPPAANPSIAADKKLKIAELNTLIDDLRFFDITTIHRRSDPKAKMLADKINDTLANIFGRNSPEYEDNSVWSFDTLPITIGGSWYPLPEVREAYQRGVNSTIAKLIKLIDSLEKDRKKSEGQRRPDDTVANTASVQASIEKISLITIRGKLRERQVASLQIPQTNVTEAPSEPSPTKRATNLRRHHAGHPTNVPTDAEQVNDEVGDDSNTPVYLETPEQLLFETPVLQPASHEPAPSPNSENNSIFLLERGPEHHALADLAAKFTNSPAGREEATNYPMLLVVTDEALTPCRGPSQTGLEGWASPPLGAAQILDYDPISVDLPDTRPLALETQGLMQPDRSQTEAPLGDYRTPVDNLLDKTGEFQLAEPICKRFGNNSATSDEEDVLLTGALHELGHQSLTRDIVEINFPDPASLGPNAPGDTVSVVDYVDETISQAPILYSSQRSFREPGAEDEENNLPLTRESLKCPQTVTSLPWANVRLDELALPDYLGYALEPCYTHSLMAIEPDFRPLFPENEGLSSYLPHSEEHNYDIPQLTFNRATLLLEAYGPDPLGVIAADAASALISGNTVENNEEFSRITGDGHADIPDSIHSKLHYAHDFDTVPPPHESLQYSPSFELPDGIYSRFQTDAGLFVIPDAHPIFQEYAALQISSGFPPSPNHPLHETTRPNAMQWPEPDRETLKFVATRATTIAAHELPLHDAEYPSILSKHMEEISAYPDGFVAGSFELFVGGFEEPAISLNDKGFHHPMAIENPLTKKECATKEGKKPVIETEQPIVSLEGALGEASNNASLKELCAALQPESQAIDRPDQETDQAAHTATGDLALCARSSESVGVQETEIPTSDRFREDIPAEAYEGVRTEPAIGQLRSQTAARVREREPEDQINRNPFTTSNPAEHKAEEEKVGLDVRDTHIAKLTSRIEDLASFDLGSIKDRFDPRIKALGDTINGTLADIFGHNTPAYWQHAIPSLDTLPSVVGGPRLSPHEIREVYKKGINDATAKLRSVLEILERRRAEFSAPGSASTDSFAHTVQIPSKEMPPISSPSSTSQLSIGASEISSQTRPWTH